MLKLSQDISLEDILNGKEKKFDEDFTWRANLQK
jgi:hypothetical protein